MSKASMLTPVATEEATCPKVDLPLPPQNPTTTCTENVAYVSFAKNVENKVGKTALKVGIAVDSRMIDIIGSVSNLLVNGVTITAAYTALMLTFPDLDAKIQKYQKLAESGWEAAEAKNLVESDELTTGYINYFFPPRKTQEKWIEKTKQLEEQLENTQNPFVRLFAKASYNAQYAAPQVKREVVRGTAKAITLGARAATATIKGATSLVDTVMEHAGYDDSGTTEETSKQKIERIGGYLDALGNIGDFFNARHEYFNKTIPPYLQFLGPLAPYAILGSLTAFGGGDLGQYGPLIATAWPLLKGAAAWTMQGSQVVASKKSDAAIDSVEFVLLQIHDLLKNTKIPATEYSDIIARFIVGVSCPSWSVSESDEKMFGIPNKNTVAPFLYFLRYAAYAYCLDPKTLKASDVAECNEINKQFSRRYYIIMDNVKGVEGFKRKLINFFLVYDLTIGCFVASFQGTTTLDEVLLDALGQSYPLQYTDNTVPNSTVVNGFAHESMLKVAQNCVALILAKLRKEHPFYLRIPIITTGHSLGAGVAAISALLLRQEHFQAYSIGIATPACMSPNLAIACKEYVVSIINNSDIVPRLSECALFNLSSNKRVCARSDVNKLVCPGNVFWMRDAADVEKTGLKQQIVQLSANNAFATSILARTDCFGAHGTKLYLESLKAVDPTADVDAIDLDFSLLFPKLPERKLAPEFLMLYLPPNVAKAMQSCIMQSGGGGRVTAREAAKAQRTERKKGQVEEEPTTKQFEQIRREFDATKTEMTKQYTILKNERDALALRVKQLEEK